MGERLNEAINLRLDAGILARMDAVEAHHRGRGRRDVSRSSLVRDALAAWLPGAEAQVTAEAEALLHANPELLRRIGDAEAHPERRVRRKRTG